MDNNKTTNGEPVKLVKEKTNHSFKVRLSKQLFHISKKPLLIMAGIILFLVISTPIVTYAYFIRDMSTKESIVNRKNAGVVLLDRFDKPFFSFYEAQTKKSTTLEQIPDYMEEAVIAVEDREFYNHPGFSIRGIFRSVLVNLQEESLAQGGSTISQQLIKNTLLSQNKTFLRKYQEVILALELERRYSKKDILEMYLNTVYLGEGAFGVEDAANTYFNKPAAKLTLAESALLTAILPAPSALSPLTGNIDRAYARQDLVLSAMRQQGYISAEQEQQAKNEKIVFNPVDDGLNQTAPHFALMVKDELIDKYGEQRVARSGFKVKTTIDLEYQEYAETTVKNQVARLNGSKVTNGAAVAIDPKTGEVLALVGSWDWSDENNGKINMVLRPRQPGSSFKPLVYAKAFEQRVLTPATKLDDKETTFPGNYKPKNYDGRYRGEVTVRRALANSLNIPAVLAIEDIGVSSALEISKRLGITTLNNPADYGYSLVLGAGEVPLIEMTNAYAVFADNGEKHDVTTILEIKDRNNNEIFTHSDNSRDVLDEDIAFLISSILSDNSARAEVFGGSLTLSRPAAVKTGTTEDYKDSLTIGYTPSLAVGVWVGNNDNTPMTSIAGSTGAAPIWRLMMERYLSGSTIERFNPTSGVISRTVCEIKNTEENKDEQNQNNNQNNNDENNKEQQTIVTRTEYFLRGTEPKDSCVAPTPTSGETPTPNPTETPKPTDAPQPTQTPSNTPKPTNTPINIFNPEPTGGDTDPPILDLN